MYNYEHSHKNTYTYTNIRLKSILLNVLEEVGPQKCNTFEHNAEKHLGPILLSMGKSFHYLTC